MIENVRKLVTLGDFGIYLMKYILLIFITLCTFTSFAQDANEELIEAQRLANNFVFEGNEKVLEADYVAAEMEYRKAISEEQSNISGLYNLGTSYFKEGNYEESLYRLQEAVTKAIDREEKHIAFHNIGNILMQNKKCKEAVEAYKNALRNDPTDEETRYNYGLAKECAKQQEEENQNNEDDQEDNKDQDQNEDQNKDNKDQDQEDKDKKEEGEDKDQDQKDEGDQDKDEGDEKENEDGKPKDDKQDQGEDDQDKKEQPQQPKPQQGKMSPQQIKNLLEAMNNQEQKVQEKMNAEKQKGERVQTDKDW